MEFAEEKHKEQFRSGSESEPYINHPIRVAKILRENKTSHRINELIAAALLHDTLEDTDANEEELKKLFGELITSIVKDLTTNEKEKEKLGKKEYLAEKMSDPHKMSNWALVIKLADRLDNIADLNRCPEDFRKRYTEETLFIVNSLKKNRNLSKSHKRLIKKIEDKLNGFK